MQWKLATLLVAAATEQLGEVPIHKDNCVRIWDFKTGQLIDRIDLVAHDCQFSPDGSRLLIRVGSLDNF